MRWHRAISRKLPFIIKFVAFTHRKSIILQCRVVYVVRGGEMYEKSVRVIERGVGLPKRWEREMEQRGDHLGVAKSVK